MSKETPPDLVDEILDNLETQEDKTATKDPDLEDLDPDDLKFYVKPSILHFKSIDELI